MDHSKMDHSGMDHGAHGGHGGHGGMDHSEPMCSMNMLFTWDTENLCIVFSGWRVTGTLSLIVSLLAIIVMTAGYEAVREASRRYEAKVAARVGQKGSGAPPNREDTDTERRSLLRSGNPAKADEGRITKAAFYAVQVFYSFFIMLLFMTYNGWIMLAVGVGAFVGYLMFSGSAATKSAACH
ncbi:unnamed protein product [Zymoseptoria tritici ST99CH_1A5]|nr:unnamed protein product [Zymoseptoria tritici ST99CH_1E4]SMR52313.1 unnamed protein product [Zymoseptoria tritici ST99CH_3D1]SMY23946.1 unnamed protein product [Zymoseptoria tritici ST99CH_1A5]